MIYVTEPGHYSSAAGARSFYIVIVTMSLNHSEITYLLSEERVAAVQTAWKRYNLELGLPGIDKQHMWLLAILLDLETLVGEQQHAGSRLTLIEFDRAFRRLLAELIDYTVEHFDLEEEFLRRIHYAGIGAHKRQHARFVAGLRMRMRALPHSDEAELLAGARKLLQSLKQWLMHHILSEDRAYMNDLLKHNPDQDRGEQECETILSELGINIRFEQERLYAMVRSSPAAAPPVDLEDVGGYANEGNIIRWVAGLWHAYRLRLGVPIIDMQHLWLIKLIAELEAAERDRALQPERVGDPEIQNRFEAAVAEVQNYVAEHFSTEEAIMREFHFPGLPGHIRQHQSFAASVNDRIAESKAGNPKALNHLVRDLKQWLIAHIAVEDRRIYYFLRRRSAAVNDFVREMVAQKRLKLRQGYLELYNEIIHFKTR
ncbi:MAG: hemerythrin family protein [Leptospirales bacterium]|jgi:hemerythrin-like metal-binding protein